MLSAIFGLALCLSCDVTVAASDPRSGNEVDVQLVLAVDVSRSMDPEEQELQRAGYVQAIRHPDFVRAVRSGVNGRIALTYFEWAGTALVDSVVPWQIVEDAASAERFASALAERPSAGLRGTSISAAIDYGATLLSAQNGFKGWRKVIDISGDGPNNIGGAVLAARESALKQGITINGLPILIRPSQTFVALDRYYAECVIGGPGAFVLPIKAASEFSTAIRRKLILEVSDRPDGLPVIRAAGAPATVCIERGMYYDNYFQYMDR